MKNATQIKARARQILREAGARQPHMAAQLDGMRLRVSTRMTSCAGTAHYGKNEITLSLPFFADEGNFDSQLFETVTHEAAHLIVGRAGREGRPHGPQWKRTHRLLGGTGNRTHGMQLAEAYAPARRKPVTVPCGCGCGQPMSLGPTQLKRHKAGEVYVLKGHRRRPRRNDGLDDLRDLLSF